MTQQNDSNTPRVALVTGGTSGIGRAVCEALLDDGWEVFLCSRSADSVQDTLVELERRVPGRASGRTTDVRDEADVKGLVDWVVTQRDGIDLLVNNAGVGLFGAVDELSSDDWHTVVRTNLDGAFYAMREVARRMKERGSGWIINICSLASRNPFAGGAAYNASKFGLLGLSDAAMLDLRHHGIRVAAVLPGSVDTPFFDGPPESWRLQPEDVARAVTDLVRYPDRALPSRIELRPSRPPK